ncbi:MAG: leucine-rich repeat protein [Muribaculaceae bacterium]|nr:leucine-rich repeat protein [Muribaculaceae bacterium]
MVFYTLLFPLISYAYDFEVNGIYYDIVSPADKTCEVTKGEQKYAGDVIIPSSVNYSSRDITVVGIGDRAFRFCSSLTSVEIPNSITSIGNNAFSGCSSLTSIEIPNSVTSIDSEAFSGCSSLTSIEIPNSVTSIGDYAFSNCSSLTLIEIPNSVTSIGDYAFSNCSSLTLIEIPNSVTSIGDYAFSNCSALTQIKLSENLPYLSHGVVQNCSSLTSLTIPGSIQYIIFRSNLGKGPSFYECNSLKSLKIEHAETGLTLKYSYDKDNQNRYELYWDDNDVASFTNQITNLYLDRFLSDRRLNFQFKAVKELTFGEHINYIQLNLESCSNLSSITCFSTTPPSYMDCSNKQYMSITVKVPYDALEAYKNAEGWKNFWNIEGFDLSGIDYVTTNTLNPSSSRQEISRYDLNGQPVPEDYKGVVIVRFSDGRTKKIIQ